MVNNIDKIKSLLEFNKEFDFYFVQIFKRRKDNPDLELGVKRLKSYSIYSLKELEEVFPKIKKICDEENARAYLRLSSQNALDVSLRCIEQLTKNIRNNVPQKGRKVWDSVAGQGGNKGYWAIDVDEIHIQNHNLVIEDLIGRLKVYFEDVRLQEFDFRLNPTKTGKHIIVKPFDTRILNEVNKLFSEQGIPSIDLNKDGNTLLYSA